MGRVWVGVKIRAGLVSTKTPSWGGHDTITGWTRHYLRIRAGLVSTYTRTCKAGLPGMRFDEGEGT